MKPWLRECARSLCQLGSAVLDDWAWKLRPPAPVSPGPKTMAEADEVGRAWAAKMGPVFRAFREAKR